MGRIFIFLVLTGLLFASCVPNKKILYMQTKDELAEGFRKDSVLREYNLANHEYKIQPEDILSVKVISLTDEEYSIFKESQNQNLQGNIAAAALSGYLVDVDGYLEFPVVGKIKVSGLSIVQIEQRIQESIKSYLVNPVVRVRLLNFRVTILGEVNQEGVIEVVNNQVSILEVIGRAGGMTDLAKRDEVKLIRKNGSQMSVSYLNLLDEELLNSPSFYLQNNDVLIIEPLKQRPFRKYFGPNLALIISSVSVLLLTFNLVK
ncbi:polysaccharide biosynthesis/export family protein [Fulvivirga sp.]|uniref:polysaccharide biosynthesis/export family protein n=1 Tax=Fulvivirga sp. TaxID=1931237 RepID=UPI0032EF771B